MKLGEPSESALVRLVCLDDDDPGRVVDVLWDLELGARVVEPERQGLGTIARLDPPDEHPARILVATDAAREGVNLQAHCADLFHLDIPWNPSRLEQRNGRIDRTLQPAEEVRCHYFVYAERDEDRILDTVVRKVETVQRELGSLGAVVLEQIERALDAGINKTSRVRDGRTDARIVELINSRLRPKPERADPVPLRENEAASFVGSYPSGEGFTIAGAERETLIGKDVRNGARIFPYVNGVEVATDPAQRATRFVISFDQMESAEAEQWPDLVAILRQRVKPVRDKDNREARRKRWWRFAETAPALYAAIRGLPRCLVTGISWTQRAFVWQPTDRILDQTLIVFPFTAGWRFAVLQSRVHEVWSVLLSATIKEDQRYNPSRGHLPVSARR